MGTVYICIFQNILIEYEQKFRFLCDIYYNICKMRLEHIFISDVQLAQIVYNSQIVENLQPGFIHYDFSGYL